MINVYKIHLNRNPEIVFYKSNPFLSRAISIRINLKNENPKKIKHRDVY